MSTYSTWPSNDFEVWESLQLFDFPAADHTPVTPTIETGFPLTATLLGARKQHEPVSVDTADGRTWSIRPRAVGKTWFSGVTITPERGVIVVLSSIVECRDAGTPDVDAAPVDVSLSRAISVTAQRTRTVRVTTTTGLREGVVTEIGTDYLRLTRRSLDGRDTRVLIPFSHLVAVEFLEPGDIS